MEGEIELVLAAHHHPGPRDGAIAAPASRTSQAAKDFLAGAIGGMAGVVAGQPLDTLRIRLQQRGCSARTASGAWRAMRAAEGARGLFRGMSYPLYTTALQNAVTFQAQRAGERGLAATGVAPGMLATCTAGMFAGAVQTFISSPVELLKIRLQLQTAQPGAHGYVGPVAMLRRVLADEGLAGLFRGCGVTLLRDTPSYGLYFVIYAAACASLEATRQRLLPSAPQPALAASGRTGAPAEERSGSGGSKTAGASGGGGSGSSSSTSSGGGGGGGGEAGGSGGGGGGASADASMPVQFLSGGLAGMLAWLSVYPLDVVKSRLQAHPAASSPYRSAWHCARHSMREEGAAVFTRGMGPTLGRAFIVNAAIFASFEAAMAAMS